MSSIPASAMTSASPIFWQVMPLAPALTCICASSGLLWVLICGRLATPAASQAAWIRAMLRSTLSMSMTAQGVPYSRAILAARGVVIAITPVLLSSLRGAERRSNPCRKTRRRGLLRFARNDGNPCGLSLFYFFAQYFQFQPAVFGRRQILLRLGDRAGSLVECLAIPRIETGIIQQLLLLRNLGLQFFD